ncbi:hypothetical protein EIP91_005399, partial [Steccherinum ochraceum]
MPPQATQGVAGNAEGEPAPAAELRQSREGRGSSSRRSGNTAVPNYRSAPLTPNASMDASQ